MKFFDAAIQIHPYPWFFIFSLFGCALCLGPVVTYRVSAVRLHGGIVSYHGIYGAQNTRLLRLPDGRPPPGQDMTTEASIAAGTAADRERRTREEPSDQISVPHGFAVSERSVHRRQLHPGPLSQAGDLPQPYTHPGGGREDAGQYCMTIYAVSPPVPVINIYYIYIHIRIQYTSRRPPGCLYVCSGSHGSPQISLSPSEASELHL